MEVPGPQQHRRDPAIAEVQELLLASYGSSVVRAGSVARAYERRPPGAWSVRRRRAGARAVGGLAPRRAPTCPGQRTAAPGSPRRAGCHQRPGLELLSAGLVAEPLAEKLEEAGRQVPLNAVRAPAHGADPSRTAHGPLWVRPLSAIEGSASPVDRLPHRSMGQNLKVGRLGRLPTTGSRGLGLGEVVELRYGGPSPEVEESGCTPGAQPRTPPLRLAHTNATNCLDRPASMCNSLRNDSAGTGR